MRPAECVGHGVERRFLALLAVSAALHAAALAWVRMPEQPRLEVPALLAVLNASLRVGSVAPERAAAPLRPAAPAAMQKEVRQSPARRELRALPAVPETAGPTGAKPAAVASVPAAEVAEAAAPAAPAMPAPAPVVDTARLLEGYGQRLAELFARQQQYPRLAALRGWEGEVRVRLSVARQGRLSAVRLERSSGYEVLDQHALAMVEAIGPLPPPPAGFMEASGDVQIVVPVHYRLRKPA